MNKNDNQKTDWSKRDVGALWRREGQNQKYLSGYIKIGDAGSEQEIKVVVFSNKNKNNNEKAPDYRVYLSKPLEKTVQTVVKQKKQAVEVKNVEEEVEEDLL